MQNENMQSVQGLLTNIEDISDKNFAWTCYNSQNVIVQMCCRCSINTECIRGVQIRSESDPNPIRIRSESDPNPIRSDSFRFQNKNLYFGYRIGLERLFHNKIGSD